MAQAFNPTRMELNKTKNRLALTERSFKLLKDKQSELSRIFMEYINEYQKLQQEISNSFNGIFNESAKASAYMGENGMREALLIPARNVSIKSDTDTVMNVTLPRIRVQSDDKPFVLPYGMAFSSHYLDNAVKKAADIVELLIRLAEVEKICDILALELQRIRRRTNALEYVKIPEMNGIIKFIKQKLDENERSNIIRLMKIKNQSE